MSDDDTMTHMDSNKAFNAMYKAGYASGAKERRDHLSQKYFEEFYKIHYDMGSDLGILKCLLDNLISNNNAIDSKPHQTNMYLQKFNDLLQLLTSNQQQPKPNLNFYTDNETLADQIGYFQIERNLENFTARSDKKICMDESKLEQAKQLYRSLLDKVLVRVGNENLRQKIYSLIKFF